MNDECIDPDWLPYIDEIVEAFPTLTKQEVETKFRALTGTRFSVGHGRMLMWAAGLHL